MTVGNLRSSGVSTLSVAKVEVPDLVGQGSVHELRVELNSEVELGVRWGHSVSEINIGFTCKVLNISSKVDSIE